MAKKKINLEAATVSFDFTADGGEVFVLNASDVPGFAPLSGTALHALLHGISQKVGDAYAAAKSQANPLQWAQEQVKATIAAIVGGNWNAGRTGEGAPRVSMLARALHAVKLAAGDTESSEAAAQAYLDGLEKEEGGKAKIAELKAKKKVAKALAAIRLADAQKKLERAQKVAADSDDDEADEE